MKQFVFCSPVHDTAGKTPDHQVKAWIPCVEEETSSGIREVSLQTKHFSAGKLFLTGEVTDEMANQFVSQFLYLAETCKKVDIFINSPGGNVSAGLLIYDVIQACSQKLEINLYCIGMAASMGAIILAGGQKGHRFILPHSKVMIHEPLIAGGLSGSATTIKKTADSILETKATLNGILAKHTGHTAEEMDEATAFDNYMSAQEAVEFGICDKVSDIFA